MPAQLDSSTRRFYVQSMRLLDDAGVEYLVGGAYAMAQYAAVERHTKDFDIFLRPQDVQPAMQVFGDAGYQTEMTFPHWLGKAFRPYSDDFIDIIFGSGNGLCAVDEQWFGHAVATEVFGRPARLVPAEEMIWTKAFIQERERFDGADVAHMLWNEGATLDWDRMERRFKGHEQVLLAHLILFTYIYPHDRERVPASVIERLYRITSAQPAASDRVCRGTLLSRAQYLMDLRERGYLDPRLQPAGSLRAQDVAHWTAAIGRIE